RKVGQSLQDTATAPGTSGKPLVCGGCQRFPEWNSLHVGLCCCPRARRNCRSSCSATEPSRSSVTDRHLYLRISGSSGAFALGEGTGKFCKRGSLRLGHSLREAIAFGAQRRLI